MQGGRKRSAAQRHSHGKEEHGPVRRKVEEGRDVCSPPEGHAVCGGKGLLPEELGPVSIPQRGFD